MQDFPNIRSSNAVVILYARLPLLGLGQLGATERNMYPCPVCSAKSDARGRVCGATELSQASNTRKSSLMSGIYTEYTVQVAPSPTHHRHSGTETTIKLL